MADEPIHECIGRWHLYLSGNLPGGLDEMLHPDVVFLSPIVYTPQRGREITKLYLRAAGSALGDADLDSEITLDTSGDGDGKFKYTKQILQGHHAMLEFETEIEGKYANGVDIITCDDDGKIIEFKVMMRPLQAINAAHTQMKAVLDKLSS